MPKVMENGVVREMTPEEVAEMERLAASLPPPEPTPEEHIAALEKALAERDVIITELITMIN